MLKPLTQEQREQIIETATLSFADQGFAGANINRIARDSGVSVGVLYKYYKDKEALFAACVRRSLDYLEQVFEETRKTGGSLMDMIGSLIEQNQKAARLHPEYFRLYHQITVSGAPQQTGEVAELIEGSSACLYRGLLEEARARGEVRQDLDPAMFAFFFDNLMMMLHFSYACGYYEDRFRVYCGEEKTADDAFVKEQMLKFLSGAFYGEHTGI